MLLCRSLLTGSAAESLASGEDGATPLEATRLPAAWLLLQPAGIALGARRSPIALPLRVDFGLPDYFAKAQDFDAAAAKPWMEGKRFRMFFAGKTNARARAGKLDAPSAHQTPSTAASAFIAWLHTAFLGVGIDVHEPAQRCTEGWY